MDFNDVVQSENINIGQWCAFTETITKKQYIIFIGRVLSFSYKIGKDRKLEYFAESAPVKPPKKNAKGIICLCSPWYKVERYNLVASVGKPVYRDIKGYLCSLPQPLFENNIPVYSRILFDKIKKVKC